MPLNILVLKMTVDQRGAEFTAAKREIAVPVSRDEQRDESLSVNRVCCTNSSTGKVKG